MFKKVFISIVALTITMGAAQASVIQADNLFPTPTSSVGGNRANSDEIAAQTFTVLNTGLLETVDVQVYSNGTAMSDLIVSIIETTGGDPVLGASPLATKTVASGDISGAFAGSLTVSIDFSMDSLMVTAGQVLAIVLSSSDPFFGGYVWVLGVDNQSMNYAGGDSYLSQNGAPYQKFSTGDYGFRVSVAPSEVPLPAALPLFLIGLGGLGFLKRRKKTAL